MHARRTWLHSRGLNRTIPMFGCRVLLPLIADPNIWLNNTPKYQYGGGRVVYDCTLTVHVSGVEDQHMIAETLLYEIRKK